jgi:tetratricopeptide (TPR) repeat protein
MDEAASADVPAGDAPVEGDDEEELDEIDEIDDFEEIDDDEPSVAEGDAGFGHEAIEAVPSGDVQVLPDFGSDADFDAPEPTEFAEPPPPPRRPMIDARTVMAAVEYPDIEEDLAEVDFLIESSLAADAQEALEAVASEHGWGHPAVQQRRDRISELEALNREADSAIAAIGIGEPTTAAPLAAASVEQLTEGDVAAHFDLGVAYMEMGQFKKAIAQLEKVVGHRERRAEALRVIGLCELQQGNASAAVSRLQDALRSTGLVRDARVGLLYDLATAYETQGSRVAARQQLQSIVDLGAADFLDTRARLTRLGG